MFFQNVLIILTAALLRWTTCLSCINNELNPVDWFIVYKLPENSYPEKHYGSFPPHLYLDALRPTFLMPNETLQSRKQAVAYTVGQAHNKYQSKSVGYIFYNDEWPDGHSHSRGHTKGVFIFDKDTAVWLIHSVPKFPNGSHDEYTYPYTGEKFGQHFLCLSLTAQSVDTVATQLIYNEPTIYDKHLPDELKSKFPMVNSLLRGTRPPHSKNHSVQLLKTQRNTQFISFAKSRKFDNDLYDSLVAPYLKSSLLTETWLNGASKDIDAACHTNYTVVDIDEISSSIFNFKFKSSKDHSKFAVSHSSTQHGSMFDSSLPYVCVGDINRQVSQEQRGGGTVCIADPLIHKQYINLVDSCRSEGCHCPRTYK